MIYNVLDLLTQVVQFCGLQFMMILGKLDALQVWIAAIGLHLVFKFILRPIFGYASSDLARNSYNAFKRGKEE